MDVTYRESRAGITEPAQAANAGAGSFLPVADVATSIVSGLSETVRRLPKPIEKQWVALLGSWRWQWFATFTFKDETHPEAAAKVFRHWTRKLDESNGFRAGRMSTYSRRCIWARGLEWQRRGVIHFHVLIGNLPYLINQRSSREAWASAWLELGNTGFAKIDAFDSQDAGLGYIAKYCAKGGEVDVSDTLRRPDLVGIAESE
jgi:hypothetical protein